ncbi:MAG: heat-inducible transcriptional repressor HrcA [Pseudomonadota bacterium]
MSEIKSRGSIGDLPFLPELNERSRQIFLQIVESYLETGDPVGSRNISRNLPIQLSPASVRNVMSDLEEVGLIYAPHTSAGRVPTDTGLRLFVDGLLQVGDLTADEQHQIEAQIAGEKELSVDRVLREAGEMISGLSRCAGVVLADQRSSHIKHIEFVNLEPGKALVVIVGNDSQVENRIIDLPKGLTPSTLTQAANYLNAHARGLTLPEAAQRVTQELRTARAELDALTQKVIKAGIAQWGGEIDNRKSLIVRGQSNLLQDLTALDDLERIRKLFDDLEAKEELVQLLGLADQADGVHIFIGSETQLFSLSGSSLIVSPFKDADRKIVGVLGVIGPTRLNYARIIPMVDYTARLVGRILT